MLETTEQFLEQQFYEHEWVALVSYDTIDECSGLAFDRITRHRVAEVARLWKRKHPVIYSKWHTEYKQYHENNKLFDHETD